MSWFRITRRRPVAAAEASEGDSFRAYMDRLIRLIPAEVIGIYLTVRTFAVGAGPEDSETARIMARATNATSDPFLDWWPVVCVALVLISRVLGTREEGGGIRSVQIQAVLISVVSFVIWVYAMGHQILGFGMGDQRYVAAAVVVWTFLIPRIYRGDGARRIGRG